MLLGNLQLMYKNQMSYTQVSFTIKMESSATQPTASGFQNYSWYYTRVFMGQEGF
jgi:hypothetical protein